MLPITTIVGNLSDNPTFTQGISRDGREWFKKQFMILCDSYENGTTVTHAFPVTFWGPRAKAVTPQKGDLVQVVVEVRNNNYVDQNTKMMVYRQEFVVMDFKILRKAQANKQQSSYNQFNNNVPDYGYVETPLNESVSFPEDDIPF